MEYKSYLSGVPKNMTTFCRVVFEIMSLWSTTTQYYFIPVLLVSRRLPEVIPGQSDRLREATTMEEIQLEEESRFVLDATFPSHLISIFYL